jgi:radical SAM-linked protein
MTKNWGFGFRHWALVICPYPIMVRTKIRIRFRKTGDLRWISHHDLMRCFERMLRRAALPFRSTEGFNPKPRLVFASPLPVGVVGCRETVDLELDAEVSPEEVHAQLTCVAPAGLEIVEVQRCTDHKPAHARLARYRVLLPPERCCGLRERMTALLDQPTCWVERKRPQRRKLDLRPYLETLRLHDGALEIDLAVTPGGTARPEEVLEVLGLGDLVASGAVVARTSVELQDEPAPLPTPSS